MVFLSRYFLCSEWLFFFFLIILFLQTEIEFQRRFVFSNVSGCLKPFVLSWFGHERVWCLQFTMRISLGYGLLPVSSWSLTCQSEKTFLFGSSGKRQLCLFFPTSFCIAFCCFVTWSFLLTSEDFLRLLFSCWPQSAVAEFSVPALHFSGWDSPADFLLLLLEVGGLVVITQCFYKTSLITSLFICCDAHCGCIYHMVVFVRSMACRRWYMQCFSFYLSYTRAFEGYCRKRWAALSWTNEWVWELEARRDPVTHA